MGGQSTIVLRINRAFLLIRSLGLILVQLVPVVVSAPNGTVRYLYRPQDFTWPTEVLLPDGKCLQFALSPRKSADQEMNLRLPTLAGAFRSVAIGYRASWIIFGPQIAT